MEAGSARSRTRSLRPARGERLRVLLVVVLTLASCGSGSVFPGEEWEKRDPERLGLDGDRLEELARTLGGRGTVIVRGWQVARWGDQETRTDWYSAAKPVFSTLLFFAVHEERIESVDAPVSDFGWKLLPQDRDMTFRHLANMTSGYARSEPPGAAWAYNDVAIQLFQKTLFDGVFRANPEEVANHPDRLGALRFEDGLRFGRRRRRLRASVRDYARIAWFWLNRGRWDGEQLLPERFFDVYLQPHVPKDLPHTSGGAKDYLGVGSFGGGSDHFTRFGPGIYGFNWWFNETGRDHSERRTWPDAPPDTIMAIGARGNCAVLFPSLRAVVVAARARWGELEAGRADSAMNQVLRLAAEAVTPTRTGAPSLGAEGVEVTGELRKWHRVTLDFEGPGVSEDDDPNPFRDYRLDVTFSQGAQRVTVPGFYAADGDAAESGASAGSRWRVHFAPDREGEWRWRASFRRGEDVAIAESARAGRPAAFDGLEGSFRVEPTDKEPPDHRGQGRLDYVGRRYLRFAETGQWFLKGGANSPENLLAFADFDQTRPSHRYAPHAGDAREGDPTWRGGRGRNLLGGLNYLSSKGVNGVYFLTMNVRGDGDDVWPWTSRDDRERFDVSKLAQWERVFSHMDRLGILMHVVTQETENDQLLDGGELGEERRLYYRELVARFSHHLALVWNLGEENTNTEAQRREFATHLRELDPYDHPIVVHTYPDRKEAVYGSLLGFERIDGASLQTRGTSHSETAEWITRSAAAGHAWVVSVDEVGPSGSGVRPDEVDPDHDTIRRRHLWPSLLAGGAGVEWYFGYRFPHDDLDLEDWRSRDRMWDQTRHALSFFREYLPFHEMESCDPLVSGGEVHCLGLEGRVYGIYLPVGEETRLDLRDRGGRFEVRWFDPRRGGALKTGTVAGIEGPGSHSLGLPPAEPGRDWAVLVRAVDPPSTETREGA